MIEHPEITHQIQKYILNQLTYTDVAKFSQLKPPKTDSNLYSYHLKALLSCDLVEKVEAGYSLTEAGANYVDRISRDEFYIRQQSKIVTMWVIQNSEGDILLQKRLKQPYINSWTLPYGKAYIEDSSLEIAARRTLAEKVGLVITQAIDHAGDCYIRAWHSDQIISSTLVHVFRLYTDEVVQTDQLKWVRPHKLDKLKLAPAVEQIMTRTFFKDSHYFEEFNVDW